MQSEMVIKGLMVDPVTNMPIVIPRDKEGDRVLPIWVGIFEANALALQIENIATPRPMTHDLLRNVISDFNGRVEKIVVTPASSGAELEEAWRRIAAVDAATPLVLQPVTMTRATFGPLSG